MQSAVRRSRDWPPGSLASCQGPGPRADVGSEVASKVIRRLAKLFEDAK